MHRGHTGLECVGNQPGCTTGGGDGFKFGYPLKATQDAVGGNGNQLSGEFLHHGGGTPGAVRTVGDLQRDAAARRHFHPGGAGGRIVNVPGKGSGNHA